MYSKKELTIDVASNIELGKYVTDKDLENAKE